MQCEEYQEAIAADPSGGFDGAGHAAACDRCSAFKAEIGALDERIAAALAIDVPALTVPELPAIEADDNVVDLPYRRRMTAPAWFAVAASVALVAFLGARLLPEQSAYPSLAAEVLAHLDHEPRALRVTDTPVSERRLTRVVREEVATFDEDFPLITYAKSCVINGKTIPHLVIQGERGPITILLMPDEKIDGAVELDGRGVNGVILPVRGGSVAIIGEREEQLNPIEERVVDSVEWEI